MIKIRANPFRLIFWLWFGYVCLFLFPAIYVSPDERAFSNGVIESTNALLAFVSLQLFRREMDSGTKAVFFNLLLLFGLNAILNPLQPLLNSMLLRLDEYSGVYSYQYEAALFFLLLPLCIVFMLMHTAFPKWHTAQKYVVSLLAVGTIWLYLFYPYFADPRYLYSTQDVAHFRQINATIQRLEKSGNSKPSSREISLNVRLFEGKRGASARELLGDEKEERIEELLPYTEGSNHTALVLKPLNIALAYMSVLSIAAIMSFLVYQYLADPPKSAYLEKVMLVFLPFCSFEALHFYVFSTLRSNDRFFAHFVVGQYFSFITMLLLAIVLSLRLKFIVSVEGRFYERHLISDSSGITRWRDAFDNWVLRQFMDAGEIERRFVINPRRDDKGNSDGQESR